MVFAVIFLASVVAANLIVGRLGPWVTPIVAFVLIGLDLSLRDKLHESWHNKGLWWKMLILIVVSGAITYLINRGAGRIAVGSVVAFIVALAFDALVYERLFHRERVLKMNASNVVSAAMDTVLFVWIAFGVFMWQVMLVQYAAKVVGGFFWSLLLSWMMGRNKNGK